MAVQCANCGEELLGAVNCCWRCGHAFEARSGPTDLPPVRRAPPAKPLARVISAEGDQIGSVESAEDTDGVKTIRRGSPFADRGSAEFSVPPAESAPVEAQTLAEPQKRSSGATTAGSLTFPIGGIALILAFVFPTGGIVVAAFGIAIGTWGLYSHRRGVALAGLMLCCASLAVAGFNTAVKLYGHWENTLP